MLNILYENDNSSSMKEYKKKVGKYIKATDSMLRDKNSSEKYRKYAQSRKDLRPDKNDPLRKKKEAYLRGKQASYGKSSGLADDKVLRRDGKEAKDKYKETCVKEYAEEVDIDDIRKEIYERELCGEITVEEREELLDYLDNQIYED